MDFTFLIGRGLMSFSLNVLGCKARYFNLSVIMDIEYVDNITEELLLLIFGCKVVLGQYVPPWSGEGMG